MSRYSDQIRDEFNRPVSGATVYVYDEVTGALDDLTDDAALPLPNPITTDEFGEFYFNAADGLKLLHVHYGGHLRWKEIIQLGLPGYEALAATLGSLGVVAGLSVPVATRVLLAALDTANKAAFLYEPDRGGNFTLEDEADWTDEIALDDEQGIFVPSTFDATKVWVRDTDKITPRMCGCVPYLAPDPATPTVERATWVHDELNAFYRLPRSQKLARRYVFDAAGEWGVADTIVAAYNNLYAGAVAEPNCDRRFVAPTLRVAPLAELPGGVALDVAFDIAGLRMKWDGVIAVHPSGADGRADLYLHNQYGRPYLERRYNTGVRRRWCAGSKFGAIQVDDAIYEGIDDDARQIAFTLDGLTFSGRNNIGMHTEHIWNRMCGSSEAYGIYAAPQTIATKAQGGNSNFVSGFGVDEVFDPVPGGYANSAERTRLEISDTSMLRVNDVVWTRLELKPAIYGTVAISASGSDSKVTWTAGDPTDYFNVGDVYPVFLHLQDGIERRIVSFGGTSNREIIVSPSYGTTLAASAADAHWQYSVPTFSVVSFVQDATHLLVAPWIPDRNNSTLHIASGGALRIQGQDSANGSYGTVVGFGCGYALHSGGLYAPHIGTLLSEYCVVGRRIGNADGGVSAGLKIDHFHDEANYCDHLVHSINTSGELSTPSAYGFDKWHSSRPRGATNAQMPPYELLGSFTVIAGGSVHSTSGVIQSFTPYTAALTNSTLTNAVDRRDRYVHDNDATATVGIHRDTARIFAQHHWARLVWTGASGGAPTGTLTLNMDAALTSLGWTFAGEGSDASYAITAPGRAVELKFHYLFATKKIAISRVDSATGFGYAAGQGGAVTQITSKSTGVTLNKLSGAVTMHNEALAAGAKVSFVVTNSTVAATDVVVPSVQSGGTANAYRAAVTAVAAGSFTITVENITGGSLSEAPVIGFAVVKAVAT